MVWEVGACSPATSHKKIMDHNLGDATTSSCCAECGNDGGVSLKACKSCMLVKYCNADCQRNHWPKHKKDCKRRAAELRDEALFKDPPAKEDCPICFLPMPVELISTVSLQTRLYRPYLCTTLPLLMSIWQKWIWNNFIHAAERLYVVDASTPSGSLGLLIVRIAIKR